MWSVNRICLCLCLCLCRKREVALPKRTACVSIIVTESWSLACGLLLSAQPYPAKGCHPDGSCPQRAPCLARSSALGLVFKSWQGVQVVCLLGQHALVALAWLPRDRHVALRPESPGSRDPPCRASPQGPVYVRGQRPRAAILSERQRPGVTRSMRCLGRGEGHLGMEPPLATQAVYTVAWDAAQACAAPHPKTRPD